MGIRKNDVLLHITNSKPDNEPKWEDIFLKREDKINEEYEKFKVIFDQYEHIKKIKIKFFKADTNEDRFVFFKDWDDSIVILLDNKNISESINACLDGIDKTLIATNLINKEKEKINSIRNTGVKNLGEDKKRYLAHIVKGEKISREENYLGEATVNDWYVNFEKDEQGEEIDGITEKLEILKQICANGEDSSTESEDHAKRQGEENIVVNELLQNVYDHIDINEKIKEKKELIITHDKGEKFISLSYPERGFSVLDFYAICTLGNSGNVAAGRGGETEGHKGTGFKSVYRYFYKVEIESRGVGCVLNRDQFWKVGVDNNNPTKFLIEKVPEDSGGKRFSNPIPEFDSRSKEDKGLTIIKLYYSDTIGDLVIKFKDKTRYLFLMDKISTVKFVEEKVEEGKEIINSNYIDNNFYKKTYVFDVNEEEFETEDNLFENSRFRGRKKIITMLFPKDLKVKEQEIRINDSEKCFGQFADFSEGGEPEKYVYCTLPIETGTKLKLPFYVNIPLFELTDSRTNLFNTDDNIKTDWNEFIKTKCCDDEREGEIRKKSILRLIYEECMIENKIDKPYRYLPVSLDENGIISKYCFLFAEVFDCVDSSKTCFNELYKYLLPKYLYKYIADTKRSEQDNNSYLQYLDGKNKEKKYVKDYENLYKICLIDGGDFGFVKDYFLLQYKKCLMKEKSNDQIVFLKWFKDNTELLVKNDNQKEKALGFIFQLYLGSETNIYVFNVKNIDFEEYMEGYSYEKDDTKLSGFFNLSSIIKEYKDNILGNPYDQSNLSDYFEEKITEGVLDTGLEDYLYTDDGFLEFEDNEKKKLLCDVGTLNYFCKTQEKQDKWKKYYLGKTICENPNVFDFNVYSDKKYQSEYIEYMKDEFTSLSDYEDKIEDAINSIESIDSKDTNLSFSKSCEGVFNNLRSELYIEKEGSYSEDLFIQKTFEYINSIPDETKKQNALEGVFSEKLFENVSFLSLLGKGYASYKYGVEDGGTKYRILDKEEKLYYSADTQTICNEHVIYYSYDVKLPTEAIDQKLFFLERLQDALKKEDFYSRSEACEVFEASYSVLYPTDVRDIVGVIKGYLDNDATTDNKANLLNILNKLNVEITPLWNDSYKEFLKEYKENISSESAGQDENGEVKGVDISFKKNLIFQFENLTTAEDLIENVRDRSDQATMDSYEITMKQGEEELHVKGLKTFIKDYVKIYKKSDFSEHKYCYGKVKEGENYKNIIVLFHENYMKAMLEEVCKIDVSKLEPDRCTYYESVVSHKDRDYFENDDVEIINDENENVKIKINDELYIPINEKKYSIDSEKIKKKLCQSLILFNSNKTSRHYFKGYGSDKCPLCQGIVLSKASSLHIKKIKVEDSRIPMLMCSNCAEAFRYANVIKMGIVDGQNVTDLNSDMLKEYVLAPKNKSLLIEFDIVGLDKEFLEKVNLSVLHRLIILNKM